MIQAYGFCFGGKKLAQAAAAGEELFKAVALVHPTNLAPEDGELFNVPVALIPSGGEDPKVMDAIWETLMKKEFAEKCVRKDFVSLLDFLLEEIGVEGRTEGGMQREYIINADWK